jgi:hypothetical protein
MDIVIQMVVDICVKDILAIGIMLLALGQSQLCDLFIFGKFSSQNNFYLAIS